MKRAYSDFIYSKIAREMASCEYMDQAIELGRKNIASNNPDPIDQYYPSTQSFERQIGNQNESALSMLITESFAFRGSATHLFCKKSLFDWLVLRAKDIPIDPQWITNIFNVTIYNNKTTFLPIILHVSGGGSPSCIYGISEERNILIITRNPQFGAHCFWMKDCVDSKNINFQNPLGKITFVCSMFIKGLSLYSKCFSNVFVDGVPGDLKHAPRFNSACSKSIAIHADIASGEHSTISPHFRNGFFIFYYPSNLPKRKVKLFLLENVLSKERRSRLIARKIHRRSNEIRNRTSCRKLS